MRILHTVENYYPSVGGSQEVVRQISERLVKLGHDVTVATSKHPNRKLRTHNGVKIVEFDVFGKEVIGYKGRQINKYKKFLVDYDYDVIMNYAAQQWATDLTFGIINKIKQPKVLVPCGFSGLYHPAYKEYFKKMPARMKNYDASVYLSDDYRDINFARKHKLKHTYLIPNGAGNDEFTQRIDFSIRKKLRISKDNLLILLVGSHTGIKGHAEAIEVFKRANIRRATLLIIANDFGDGCGEICKDKAWRFKFSIAYRRQKKQLLIKNLSRIQTVAAYKESDIFFFPSNVEASPLVLFEAMASKLPFLTSDVGNSKEIIKWSKGGELLPTTKDQTELSHVDIEGSKKMLESWSVNPSKRKKLGEQGYSAWQKKFTWENITKRYEDLYKSLLSNRN